MDLGFQKVQGQYRKVTSGLSDYNIAICSTHSACMLYLRGLGAFPTKNFYKFGILRVNLVNFTGRHGVSYTWFNLVF